MFSNHTSGVWICLQDEHTSLQTLATPRLDVLTQALVPTLLLLAILLMWSLLHKSDNPRLPPGSMGLPFLGETLEFFKNKDFFETRRRRYGPVFKTHILGSPVIRVIGAPHVRTILFNEDSLVTAYWPTSVRLLLGEGSVGMAIGGLHRSRRRALQKAFNHHALSQYLPIMHKVVKSSIDSWCHQPSVLAYDQCKTMTFTLAAQVLVGFDLTPPELEELMGVFDTFCNNLFSLPLRCPGLGLLKGITARGILLERIESCLLKKEGRGEAGDAMSRLISGHDALSLAEVKDLCLELLFAGFSTLSSAATSLLYYLHQNSEVMGRLELELAEHGLAEEDTCNLSLNTLGKLKYAGAVVKEVLRIAPPIGGGFRTVLKPFTLNGYQIPAGWKVVYSIRETHLSSDVEHVQKFQPERWLEKDQHKEETLDYIPFGGGARMCVGKQYAQIFLRVFLVELVRS
ncbi:cytochrome P450 26A1-like [Physella acuta]|uniref:cytochrome P450 26A1-like n=1 Tax=Physella acuta TaxID=109671 RepID=UPI0027DB3560|nr:cytochrome P450 26A1-like [Physella acuta]